MILFYTENVTVVMLLDSTVFQDNPILDRVKDTVGQGRLDPAERHDEKIGIRAIVNPARDGSRPRLGVARRRLGANDRAER